MCIFLTTYMYYTHLSFVELVHSVRHESPLPLLELLTALWFNGTNNVKLYMMCPCPLVTMRPSVHWKWPEGCIVCLYVIIYVYTYTNIYIYIYIFDDMYDPLKITAIFSKPWIFIINKYINIYYIYILFINLSCMIMFYIYIYIYIYIIYLIYTLRVTDYICN